VRWQLPARALGGDPTGRNGIIDGVAPTTVTSTPNGT